MTWLELHRRHALPLGTSEAMALALDRMHAGQHVGPKARAKGNKLVRLLEEERSSRASTDWKERDRLLRQDGRAPTRPDGALSPSAPSRSPAGSAQASPAGGRTALPTKATGLDASRLSDQEYRQLLVTRGLDTGFLTPHNDFSAREARLPPTQTTPSLALRLKQQRIERQATEAQARRAQELEAGKIDARTEKDPAKVANRVAALLGPHADRTVVESFRPGGEPLKPPDHGPDPLAQALEARRKAERRARQAVRSGKPLDTREMDDATFQAYLQIKRFAGAW